MQYRASAMQVLLKYHVASEQLRPLGQGSDTDPRMRQKRAINLCDHYAQRLVASPHCGPRLTRAICDHIARIANARPIDDPAQGIYDQFIEDLQGLLLTERRGRERPEHNEARIVLYPCRREVQL